jgi:uncharacterized membrane-anchored protein
MRFPLLLALTTSIIAASARAEEPAPQAVPAVPPPADAPAPNEQAAPEVDEAAAFEATLSYKEGDIVVGKDLATLHLGNAFRFLGPEDTEKVLVAWGNLPGSKYLGSLFPAGTGATTDGSFAVLISYTDDGHVDDDDAEDIDYAEMLTKMKEGSEEESAERQKQGLSPLHLVGWAEPPHYDKSAKKLYWAKELDAGRPEHELNYDIRVLGRKGVLQLSALASLKDLGMVKAEMPKVLKAVEFNQGSRYADFDPDVDKVAEYGLGALVAGTIVAKTGLFKVLIGALIAGKKLVLAGIVAIGAVVKKFLGKKDTTA